MNKKTLIIAITAVCLTGGGILILTRSSDRPAPPTELPVASKTAVPPPIPETLPVQKESLPPESKAAPDSAAPQTAPALAKAAELMTQDPEEYDPETEWELNEIFEAEVMETFPVYTVQTHNPIEEKKNPEFFGPPKNEIWIRIKPENSREMKEIMVQVADLYRQNAGHPDDEITVLHWVGGRPWAKETYGPEDSVN